MINKKANKVTPGKYIPNDRDAERAEKTKSTQASQVFKDACEKAGIPATKRQAIKFKQKKGLAYKSR